MRLLCKHIADELHMDGDQFRYNWELAWPRLSADVANDLARFSRKQPNKRMQRTRAARR